MAKSDSSVKSLDEVARHWDDNAASWASELRAGRDVYREFYNTPAFLKFVGYLAGKDVLDAGCGEGSNTRIFARTGGRMTGADLSPGMIAIARQEEAREPLGIRYEIASYTELAPFADASFDAVVSTMALMDGPDLEGAFRAMRRVLKPGGDLCFSVIHPCFGTKGFAWIRDQNGHEIALRQSGYWDQTPWVSRWKFQKENPDADNAPLFAVPRFDYILSDYINGIVKAGLELREIEEPRPSEEACREHPWLARWREHAPLFLYFRARRSQ